MDNKKSILLIISTLIIILVPIILYGFNFNSTAFDRDLYKEEFLKYDVYNNLKDNGKFHIVIGDSLMAGIYIPADILIGKMGNSLGYKLEEIKIARTRYSGQRHPSTSLERYWTSRAASFRRYPGFSPIKGRTLRVGSSGRNGGPGKDSSSTRTLS